MNTRCYRCGWSFSLSREEIEAAVAAAMASGEKIHAERCPHCRQVIKLPVEQLRRALPPGWTPDERQTAAEPAATETEAAPATEAQAEPAAAAPAKPRRHHRSSGQAPEVEAAQTAPPGKPRSGKPAAGSPAAKKTARKQSKP